MWIKNVSLYVCSISKGQAFKIKKIKKPDSKNERRECLITYYCEEC